MINIKLKYFRYKKNEIKKYPHCISSGTLMPLANYKSVSSRFKTVNKGFIF